MWNFVLVMLMAMALAATGGISVVLVLMMGLTDIAAVVTGIGIFSASALLGYLIAMHNGEPHEELF